MHNSSKRFFFPEDVAVAIVSPSKFSGNIHCNKLLSGLKILAIEEFAANVGVQERPERRQTRRLMNQESAQKLWPSQHLRPPQPVGCYTIPASPSRPL